MKRLFNKLFRRPVTLDMGLRTYVRVVNSDKKENDLFTGYVSSVNFNKRTLTVTELRELTLTDGDTYTLSFDNIVTISRMNDGRLRMWVTGVKR